jgi:hypothetical protein
MRKLRFTTWLPCTESENKVNNHGEGGGGYFWMKGRDPEIHLLGIPGEYITKLGRV